MTRGYVILAENTEDTDYVKCAEVLAQSIRRVMPDANITIISNSISPAQSSFNVVPLPYGDLAPDSKWKLINDWQVYEASPYDETIKLEADMILPRSIEHWWDILAQKDVVLCTTIRNFKSQISAVKYYRRFIQDNKLPDVYNAITYFRKSDTASKFFLLVREVFENWDEYRATLKCKSTELATTDWAYAIAAHILGVENTTLPTFTEMSMVHMKEHINELTCEDWTQALIYECNPEVLRIQTFPQCYPFHYHMKSFADIIRGTYEKT